MDSGEGMMYALEKVKAEKGYEYKKVKIPDIKDDEVLIKVEYVSLCGSDILLYNWAPKHMAESIAQIPFIPGHEGCGIVTKIGKNVKGVQLGQRVAPETHIPCEKCYQCTHLNYDGKDQKNICQHMGLFGHGKGGAAGCSAQYTVVPANAMYVLKTNLNAKYASLLEPFGVAYRTVEDANVKNDTLLVIGCGPIGAAAVALANHFSARKILCVDVVQFRLDIVDKVAKANNIKNYVSYNAENVKEENIDLIKQWVLKETDGDGVGCVIEASGALMMVNNCFSWLRKGGTIVMVGLPKGDIVIKDPLSNFIFKELTVKTMHGRRIYETWEKLEVILSEKKIDIDSILTHEFPMKDVDKAFQAIFDGTACKVQLKVEH